jgi:hypothetical protein
MKKIIYSIVFCSLLFAVSSCKKTGGQINPLSSINNFGVGSYLVLNKTISENFNLNSIASSSVGVTVHQFSGGEAIDHVEIWASASSDYDSTKWRKVKSVPYEGDSINLTVNGAELATAIGISTDSIKPGAAYTFFNKIFTKSGKQYDVNNTGTNDGSGINGGPTYNASFVFTGLVICPYTSSMAGTYTVIKDEWADNEIGQTVVITDGPEPNTLDISGAWPGNSIGILPIINHLIIKIDPETGVVSVDETIFEDDTYFGSGAITATSGSGYAFSCTGKLQLSIVLSAEIGGDLGPYRLILQKIEQAP